MEMVLGRRFGISRFLGMFPAEDVLKAEKLYARIYIDRKGPEEEDEVGGGGFISF
jgi:hypothetical protein